MQENRKKEGINAGAVRVIMHGAGKADKAIEDAAVYWKNTMGVFGFANNADFDIHIWDEREFSHMEVGIRIYDKKGFDGIVSRAILVLDVAKDSGKGVFIVDAKTSPWHEDIQGFAEDTASILKRHGFNGFEYMDMGDFERKFFAYEPMLLSEDGRRIARSGKALLDEGYKTFGLTDQAMVEMLL